MPPTDETGGVRAARPAEVAEFSTRFPTPGVAILTVSGELDISTSGGLHHALEELLDAGTQRIEVDLSAVVFMDSSALSALVGAHDRATKDGRRLALVRPSPACAKVLGITGLDRVFDLI
jgi:anti-anti-sigma factor